MYSSTFYETSRIVGDVFETRAQLEVEWKISLFPGLPERVNEYYHSRMFCFAGADWYLQVFPYGETKFDTKRNIGVYLVRGDSGPPIKLSFELGIKKADGTMDTDEERKTFFSSFSEVFDKKDATHGYCSLLKKSELMKRKSELAPFDVLTIVCNLRYQDETKMCAEESVRRLQDDLEKLLVTGADSDVILIVQGREFRAHRLLLRARSPELLAAMHESMEGLVIIDDLNPETFPDFLNYLYTGNDEKVTLHNVLDLHTAANKYNVERLKRVCLKFMVKNICMENFCDLLAFSLLHQKPELTEAATQFFAQNVKEIILTSKWQAFISEHPMIGNELLIKYFQCS